MYAYNICSYLIIYLQINPQFHEYRCKKKGFFSSKQVNISILQWVIAVHKKYLLILCIVIGT